MEKIEPRERRYKVLYLSADEIVRLVSFTGIVGECFKFAEYVGESIEEAEAITAHFFPDRNAFGILLFNEEWPEIPLGQVCPEVKATYRVIKRSDWPE